MHTLIQDTLNHDRSTNYFQFNGFLADSKGNSEYKIEKSFSQKIKTANRSVTQVLRKSLYKDEMSHRGYSFYLQ